MLQASPSSGLIQAVWREPFALGSPRVEYWHGGMSVAEMAARMPDVPAEFWQHGRILVNGQDVPREMWAFVRPKPSTVERCVDVTLHLPAQGGSGGQGRKSIFGLIAAIALTFVTGGIAQFGIPLLNIAGRTVGVQLLAASVGIVGALVIGALSSPPVRSAANKDDSSDTRELEPASVSGNPLEPNAAIPRVIGTRRVFPPFAFEPICELIGQDEYIEAVHCLAGPHLLQEIRLGDTTWDPSALDSDLTIETRSGLPGEQKLKLTRRQGRTFDLGLEMSVHGTDAQDQSKFALPYPVWHGMATAEAPDEAWVHIMLAGLTRQQDPAQKLRIPFRIRMRRRGDSAWRYLPEIHYMDASQAQRRVQIKFLFGEAFEGVLPNPSQDRGFVEARKLVPGQNVLPVGADFASDPYFSVGAGNDVYRYATNETTNVRNILLAPDMVTVCLSAAAWPAGVYEIEIMRGATFRNDLFTSSTYVYNGSILDFYGSTTSNNLPLTREGLLDRVQLRRIVSIRNQYPIAQKNLALIALKVRNRAVGRLSVKASGYVRDLNQYDLPTVAPTKFEPLSFTTMAGGVVTGNAAFEADVVLPTSPPASGVIWDAGRNAPSGASIFTWSAGAQLQLRAGDGTGTVSASNANTCVLNVPTASLPFDGKQHRLAWDVRINPGRVRLWVDNVLIGEASTTGGGSITAWAATDLDMGWLTANGGSVAGITTGSRADWPNAALSSALRMYPGQLFTTAKSTWGTLVVTSNPAPHYLDMLTGPLNFDPMPDELVDFDGLAAWRQACIDNAYSCDLVAEGEGLADVLRLVAACGYARPYQSEIWGVIRDYDRSAEAPVQVFSPRNMAGFSWKKAFPRVPAGLRVNYRNEDLDYAAKQIMVYRRGAEGTDARTEQVTYDGFVEEAKIIGRAQFDLAQAEHRSTFYSFSAPVEAIVCRRGSLVAVSHDILTRHYGFGRIKSVLTSGGNVTGIVLDSTIEVKNSPDLLATADMLAVPDMLEVGLKTGIAIRRANGTTTVHALSNAAGETDTLMFVTPVANDMTSGGPFDGGPLVPEITEGCLVVAGTLGREFKRLIVTEIANGNDLTANLTLVDEAPQLWSSAA